MEGQKHDAPGAGHLRGMGTQQGASSGVPMHRTRVRAPREGHALHGLVVKVGAVRVGAATPARVAHRSPAEQGAERRPHIEGTPTTQGGGIPTCFSVRIRFSAVYESRPLVGSSSTSTAGAVTSSMPMVTLEGEVRRGRKRRK